MTPVDWESKVEPGDLLLVDIAPYVHGAGLTWCPYLRKAPGSASVYPYKVQVPDRGEGQFRASEVYGWRAQP